MQLAAMSAAFPARLFRIAVPVWRWDHRQVGRPAERGLSREELQTLFKGDLWPGRPVPMLTEREVEDHAKACDIRGALYPDEAKRR